MDPDEALRLARERSAELLDRELGADELAEAACALAEYVQALDGWLSRGGFLPRAWAR